MRLIDADALLKFFVERQEMDRSGGEWADCFMNSAQEISTEWWCVEDDVESAPTIDAAPVVHARWVKDTYNGRTCCSACKVALPGVWYYNGEDEDENYDEIDPTSYCPNCGAKMGDQADAD